MNAFRILVSLINFITAVPLIAAIWFAFRGEIADASLADNHRIAFWLMAAVSLFFLNSMLLITVCRKRVRWLGMRTSIWVFLAIFLNAILFGWAAMQIVQGKRYGTVVVAASMTALSLVALLLPKRSS